MEVRADTARTEIHLCPEVAEGQMGCISHLRGDFGSSWEWLYSHMVWIPESNGNRWI